ncbi:hypothetical protein E3P99_02695 [Wallemia hederae]|uniref:Elongator complex protein 5 n=1 Tax=Wallemia hederae TaxID=1540922 RepID=A0A4T0FJD8_9BASI|nr:hypothetical protein E3P99_02695 [Wallemia hederae]
MGDVVRYGECYEEIYRDLNCMSVDDRMVASIGLTRCDVDSNHLGWPLECSDYLDSGDISACTQALSRSPQLWNTYSGYLRDSFKVCQILKPQSTLNKELFVVNELAELMTKLQELLNREEVRSDEYFNHMNNLFKAIYIHLEKTADNVSAGVGDRVENILTNKLDSGVVRYLGGITRSLSLLFHYNLLLLLLTWLFKALYWLLRILVRLIKCVILFRTTMTMNTLGELLGTSTGSAGSTQLISLTHSPKQPLYALIRSLATEFLRSGAKVTILCYEQSPAYYKKALSESNSNSSSNSNSNSIEYIDLRFTDSTTPTLPSTALIIDSLERFNNLPQLLRHIRQHKDKVLTLTKHTSTTLINTLHNVSSTSSITALTAHPLHNYNRVRTEYGLKHSHPSFYKVLHELLAFDSLPPDQHCLGTYVVEYMVRSSVPKQPLVRRALYLVKHGAGASASVHLSQLSDVDGSDKNSSAQKDSNTDNANNTDSQPPPPSSHSSSSFNLSLTSAQKAARETVPLPYLQAQQEVTQSNTPPPAPIISYDPDSADDWDDEDPDDDLDV